MFRELIALAVWGLLWLHVNFRIFFSISMRNVVEIFIGIESENCFW